jgi:dipeptidyl aminopeptidase/acylaminoacyl peptidase
MVELRRGDGRFLRVLSRANVDALHDLQWRPPEEFVVRAADGRTDLHGLLYKPYDFDQSATYPVIECIYGGPHLSLMGTWGRLGSFLGWDDAIPCQALAQLGFIVFIVDGRGTPDRGKAFQDFGHGEMGLHEIPEHVSVLKGLARERSYMDLKRVGVLGRSFGGYLVLRAMLTAPDVYHVGAANDAFVELDDIQAHRPEVRSYVPYLGWLEENRDAYALVSVLPLVKKLEGKLLLSHGEGSYSRQAQTLTSAFSDAGKDLDLLPPLPGQDHFLAGAYGKRWQEAVRIYFQTGLMPDVQFREREEAEAGSP